MSEAERDIIMRGGVTIAERRVWGETLASAAAAAEKDKELIAFYASETKALRGKVHGMSAELSSLQKANDRLCQERDELKAQVEFEQLHGRRRDSQYGCESVRHDAVAEAARLAAELSAAKELARADQKFLENALRTAQRRVETLEQRCVELGDEMIRRTHTGDEKIEHLLAGFKNEIRDMVSDALTVRSSPRSRFPSRSIGSSSVLSTSTAGSSSHKNTAGRQRHFSRTMSRVSEQARLRMSFSRWRNAEAREARSSSLPQ